MSKLNLRIGRERAVGAGIKVGDRRFLESSPEAKRLRELVMENEHRFTRLQIAREAGVSQPRVSKTIYGWRSPAETRVVLKAVQRLVRQG